MPSILFFLIGTLLLSVNLIRPFGLAVSDWFYFLSMASALIETITTDKKNGHTWYKNKFLLFAFLILLGGVISFANSRDYLISIEEIIQQLYAITLFISLIWIMVNRGFTEKVVTFFILSGVFAAMVACVDYLTGSRFGPLLSNTPHVNWWGRFAGPLGHPNKLGFFLVITSLLTFAKINIAKSMGKKVIWGTLLIVEVFGIYLSGSVTAFIGLIFGGTAFILASLKMKTAPIKVFSIFAVVTLVVIVFSIISDNARVINLFQTVWDNIDRSINRVQLSTANSRLITYKEAIRYISESPIFGMGFDQISTSGSAYRLLDIHNVFIQIWYAGGLFAFLGLAGIYVWMGVSAIKILLQTHLSIYPRLITALAAITLSTILMDQFQDAMYQREKWLAFGLFSTFLWIKGKA